MLLAVDVGNTSVTIGAFERRRLLARWEYPSSQKLSLKDWVENFSQGARKKRVTVDAAVFGSVVPPLDFKIHKAIEKAFGVSPMQVSARSPLGLRFKVKNSDEVGADRILNALAAKEIHGLPAIVIDFGTATTFDCVSADSVYLGGAILAGPNMTAWALKEKTAKLPLVEVKKPKRALGKDTIECIQAGLYFGYLGMIEKILDLSLKEMRIPKARTRLIATGGLSHLFKKDLPGDVLFAPNLTLEGLRIAWEKLR